MPIWHEIYNEIVLFARTRSVLEFVLRTTTLTSRVASFT